MGVTDETMTGEDRDFYLQLGERVARLRKEQHLTQVQLAQILGISQQQVASYENGRRKIPASVLPALHELFNVPLEEILGIKEAKTKRGPVAVLNRQVEQIKLLPRTKQRFVMEMLDTVIKQQRL